ncbi:uncharacterized protein BT62DRAFT_1011516 [Guyanagaster necrorhizus]|uniref:Uncharacterized protein n=1 Tax=Guyanagaster necrorhizus TaxID=856835 RepID=A0A9P7VJ06_9AGAR|nr:uncharacterized protein BT62DRAFT_1011516 [Guyanagaster necrorhizus MCA 3950]KAG7441497.1 hypothetical protein BT62DRAFT_1011516 [Guyanagaster necrorhizus MCA 3950]
MVTDAASDQPYSELRKRYVRRAGEYRIGTELKVDGERTKLGKPGTGNTRQMPNVPLTLGHKSLANGAPHGWEKYPVNLSYFLPEGPVTPIPPTNKPWRYATGEIVLGSRPGSNPLLSFRETLCSNASGRLWNEVPNQVYMWVSAELGELQPEQSHPQSFAFSLA